MNVKMNFDKLIIDEIEKRNNQNVTIIGIDGPTAVGKTILANRIASKIKKNVFIFRLDWTLKNRKFRENKLKFYKNNNTQFLYEAEEHMDLSIAYNFLNAVKNHDFQKKREFSTHLKNLYNREKGSENNLSINCKLKKNSIIIIEGHYTAHSEICKALDYNILLLGQKKELLNRKIDRVKNYRDPEKTIKYFNLIDVPSFKNYLSRYGYNYNLIIDNTNYKQPKKLELDFINNWINKKDNKDNFQFTNIDKNLIYKKINLSEDIKKNFISKNEFESLIKAFLDIDSFIGKNLKTSINEVKIDINEKVNIEIKKLKNILKGKSIEFVYTNNFHNLYHRKFPINMGLVIKKNKTNIFIIIDINEKKLDFYFHWYGGTEKINFNRTISESNPLKYNFCSVEKLNILKSNFKKEKIIKSYIPTDITFIDFFRKKFENKKILTSSEELNISSSEIKKSLSSSLHIRILQS